MQPLEFLRRYEAAYEAEISGLGTSNILVTGNSGVGKSTLINAVFGKTVAPEGVGGSETLTITYYTAPHGPIGIFDTRGFEIGNADETVAAVHSKIASLRESLDANDQIHIVWTCILEQSHRVEAVQISMLTMLRTLRVPTLVLITQALERNTEMNSEVHTLAVPNDGVLPILSRDIEVSGHVVPAYGVDDLVDVTIRLLPEAQKRAFIAAQTARWDLREKEALKAINKAAMVASSTALIPVPGGPSAALLSIQLGMIASICAILGLRLDKLGVQKLGSMLGVIATRTAGKKLFNLALAEALKMFPGAGTTASIIIGAPVGAALTKMLGNLWLDLVKGYARRGEPLPSEELLIEQMNKLLAANRRQYRAAAEDNG
jgi:predicted GTPase